MSFSRLLQRNLPCVARSSSDPPVLYCTDMALDSLQIEVLRATPAQLDETGTLGDSIAASFMSLGGGALSFWSVEKGETLTDLVVEEFQLDDASATGRPSPPLSPLPRASIALVDGIPGRAVVSYAPPTRLLNCAASPGD